MATMLLASLGKRSSFIEDVRLFLVGSISNFGTLDGHRKGAGPGSWTMDNLKHAHSRF